MRPDHSVPGMAPVAAARGAARRQARQLSAGLAIAFGTSLALVLVVGFVVLDYRFSLAAHRLVKLVLGGGLAVSILLIPRFGFFLLPVATPFLSWVPRIPVPGVSILNLLLFTVFASWALGRIFAREPIVRRTRLGGLLVGILLLCGLSIVRGAAFPTGYGYNGVEAAWSLMRGAMTFAYYFLAFWMVRGSKDRRRMGWAIVLGLLAEALVTVALGRNGRGGRAVGSFGQSNELGAFLAMFTAFAAAQLPAARHWLARITLGASVVAGSAAVVLTVSRGAVIALVAALLLVTLRSSRVLTLTLLVVLVTSPLWAPDYLKERLMSTQVESEASDEAALEGSAQIRVDTWRAILKVVSEHPLDGVGFSGLGYVLPAAGEELGVEVKSSSHNTYLRFLGEMGVLGLTLILVLLWRCWTLAREGMRLARDRAERQLSLGLAAATLAMAISCAFGDRFFSPLIAGNFWLACALVDDLVSERRAELA
jgi:putative inorganic carbon (HCO3(-)) transporter